MNFYLMLNFFGFGLERMLRKERESCFEKFLENEVSHDLKCVITLSTIPLNERTEGQNFLYNFLTEKYIENESCSNQMYSGVSVQLRRKYNTIHRRIMEAFSINCDPHQSFFNNHNPSS